MGTRSITIFMDGVTEKATEIAVMYRQMDGYPTGHGAELKSYLKGAKVVNGIPCGGTAGRIFNGPDDLAAACVSHFKGDKIGDIYLMAAGTRDVGECYRYYVGAKEGEPIRLKVTDDRDRVIYDGPVDKFKPKD